MSGSLTCHRLRDPPGTTPSRFGLILHGLGDSHRGWAPVPAMLDLPGWGWLLADAPLPYGDGWSWFSIELADQSFRIDHGQLRASATALAGLIAQLCAELAITPAQLALIGFSQGATMVLDHALRAPAAYAGVVAISGFLAEAERYPAAFGAAARQQRLLVTHGTEDPLIPWQPVERQMRRLQELGVPLTWRLYDKEHTLDPQQELGDIRTFLLGAGARAPG